MDHRVKSARRYHPTLPLVLIAVVYVLTGLFNGLAQRDTGNTAYEVFRTKALRADSTRGTRRILLAGGSNVIWGYRSARIEGKLGIPTTNLGLEREGEDPAAVRALVLDVARPGDIVVYASIEFWGISSYDEIAANQLLNAAGISNKNDAWGRWVSTVSRFWAWTPRDTPIAKTIPAIIRRYVLKAPSSLASKYNTYGDIKECEKKPFAPYKYEPPKYPLTTYVATMTAFRDRLKARGAQLVLDIPMLYTTPAEEPLWRAGFKPLLAALSSELPLTSHTIEDLTSADLTPFCDTAVHLANWSAERRTDQLAEFLLAHEEALTLDSSAAGVLSIANSKDRRLP